MLRNNTSFYYGGALRAISASADFLRCRIEGNQCTGGNGGGLAYYWNGTPTITDCEFVGNWCFRGGGGLFIFSGQGVVDGCWFRENVCLTDGGAIDNVESELNVSHCV